MAADDGVTAEKKKYGPSDFEIAELLGRGALYQDGKEVAIKKIPLSKESRTAIENEISIMRSLDNEYFVRLISDFYVEEEDEMWIVQEYCPGGSLADVMQYCSITFDESQVKWAIYSIAKALTSLHSQNRIHRDIKAANTLLAKDGGVKLTDLGVAALLDEKTQCRQTAIGSPFWMAPEVIQKSQYGKKADIWSLGITAIELAEGAPPLKDVHPFRALFLIPTQPPPKLTENPSQWSAAFHNFVTGCLSLDPASRPSVEELLAHEFLQDPEPYCLVGLCEQAVQKMDEIRLSIMNDQAAADAAAAHQAQLESLARTRKSGDESDDTDDRNCDDDSDADSDGSLVVVKEQPASKTDASERESQYQQYVAKLRENGNR